jgi:hypothetical protein
MGDIDLTGESDRPYDNEDYDVPKSRVFKKQSTSMVDRMQEGFNKDYEALLVQCKSFWWVSLLGLLVLLTMISIIFATNRTWTFDRVSENIVSHGSGIDVEIHNSSNLILHQTLKFDRFDVMYVRYPNSSSHGSETLLNIGNPNNFQTVIHSKDSISFSVPNSHTKVFGTEGVVARITSDGMTIASGGLYPMFGSFVVSDRRIKTNITDIEEHQCVSNIMKLVPREYHYIPYWNSIAKRNESSKIRGFISQEVEKVLPNAIKDSVVKIQDTTIKDFKNIRKEDIITELVGTAKYMVRLSIEMYVFGICSSPYPDQLSANNTEIMHTLCDCLDASDPGKTKCMCNQISLLCESDSESIACNNRNPVLRTCLLCI